jgi:hypothetical protein
MDPSAFAAARIVLTRSYAASSFIHHVFGAQYAPLDRIVSCWHTGEIPVIGTDFDLDRFVDAPEWSPIRLSPCLVHAMGPSGSGEFVLAMGAIGLALVASLETVRTFLEVVVSDLTLNEAKLIPAALLAQRGRLEKRIVDISPPTNPDAPESESIEWLKTLDYLMEKARNSEIQPPETIPWY